MSPGVLLFSSGIWDVAPGTAGNAGSANAWAKTWLHLSCRWVWVPPGAPGNARVLNLPGVSIRIRSCKPDPEVSDTEMSPSACWRKQWTANSFYPSCSCMGSGMYFVRPALSSLSLPWCSGIPERPKGCHCGARTTITQCTALCHWSPQVFLVLSEKVLYLRCHI